MSYNLECPKCNKDVIDSEQAASHRQRTKTSALVCPHCASELELETDWTWDRDDPDGDEYEFYALVSSEVEAEYEEASEQ